MGTRLYPQTKNTAILEKLADVPEGTARRLQLILDEKAMAMKIIDRNDKDKWWDTGKKYYDIIHDDYDLNNYHDFLVFGWGKLNEKAYQFTSYVGEESGLGNIEDLFFIEIMLQCMEIELPESIKFEDLEGLHWS